MLKILTLAALSLSAFSTFADEPIHNYACTHEVRDSKATFGDGFFYRPYYLIDEEGNRKGTYLFRFTCEEAAFKCVPIFAGVAEGSYGVRNDGSRAVYHYRAMNADNQVLAEDFDQQSDCQDYIKPFQESL